MTDNNNCEVWFIGINTSYTHTNPAIRSLAAKSHGKWIEFNINQHKDDILREIYNIKPKIAAFSCYIWNIEYVLEIAENLKKILPDVKILLGGPEVSYNADRIMKVHTFIDGIMCGEGEDIIEDTIDALYEKKPPPGVLMRRYNEVIGTQTYNTVNDLNQLGNPFENYKYDPNKIYYYESSRGCPYNCAYCLSGDNVSLRYKSIEKVKADLDLFADRNVKLIKFVDRTFNADRKRAYQILKYIIENSKFANCRFHFEIGLDLLDEETLKLLNNPNARRIQFEAGIQTCNEKTLNLIARRTDIEKSVSNARYLTEETPIELHLDLIAGLPGEDFESFKDSFNRVYEVYPHSVQLGFLKVLNGTRLREDAEKYGIVYRGKPPYEVLMTSDITPWELYILKGISGLLGRYYNTGRARTALDYLTRDLNCDPFDLYLGVYKFSVENRLNQRPLSAPDQFRLLMDYMQTILSPGKYRDFLKHLKEDYLKVKIKGAIPKRLASI